MIGLEHIAKEFKLEYKKVAEIAGVSSQTVQDWLKERRKIPHKRLEILSAHFGLPKQYFQKDLSYGEREEVYLHYLKGISEEIDAPVYNEDNEVIGSYKRDAYEKEIQYLEEKKRDGEKKQAVIKKLEIVLNMESNEAALLSKTSNLDIINETLQIMQNEKVVDHFSVIVFLLNYNYALGGKAITKIEPELRGFAEDVLNLMKKHNLTK
ncbi:helix-turn-helix domain-containing protein [Planococcus salinus]|uniref:HTH cro/C1-type domain-containing protein n=1 Tax=Planococcus salinus TaxID=1848460 RepID=A0A3M8P3K4_9BACL|nr:helix-turn-helix transcriptional regulator [Planococcus salinus]RNF38267.1 hypothetical protein EEX84_15515 [Planococcus salinus]